MPWCKVSMRNSLWYSMDSWNLWSVAGREVRALIKAEFPELKEKDMYWTAKSGYSRKPWWKKPTECDWHWAVWWFQPVWWSKALKQADIKLDAKEKKQLPLPGRIRKRNRWLTRCWRKPAVWPVQLPGQSGRVCGDLRDAENIALNPKVSTTSKTTLNVKYSPMCLMHGWQARWKGWRDWYCWIWNSRHFYVYQPPRDLSEIDAERWVPRLCNCYKRCIHNGEKYAEYQDSGIEWLGEIPGK